MDASILKEIGLTNAEIKVYIALLQSGPSLASRISKISNVERTATYQILENLIRKGIVSYVTKQNKKHFSAGEPEKLKEILKRKEDLIDELLLDLTKIKNQKECRFSIEFLREEDGRKTAFYDLIRHKSPYYVIGNTSTNRPPGKKLWSSLYWNKLRVENKVKRYLLDIKPPIKKYLLTKSRILPGHLPEFKTPAIVYGIDEVLLFPPGDIIIKIINKEFHDLLKVYFDILWKMSRKVD